MIIFSRLLLAFEKCHKNSIYVCNIWGFKIGFMICLSDPGRVSQNHDGASWIEVHVQAGWIYSSASEALPLQGRRHGVEVAGYSAQGILHWALRFLIFYSRNHVIKLLEYRYLNLQEAMLACDSLYKWSMK